MRSARALLAALVLFASAPGARAQDEVPDPSADPPAEAPAEAPAAPPPPAEPLPPIYEDQLLRLAEILGALSLLRGLCGETDAAAWREEMNTLLAAEQPSPQRRAHLIGRFNHGFETYNAVYRSCTPSARRAIRRYLAEGQALASDVRSRYSQ